MCNNPKTTLEDAPQFLQRMPSSALIADGSVPTMPFTLLAASQIKLNQ